MEIRDMFGLPIAFAALIVAGFSWSNSKNYYENTLILTAANTRIQTCRSIGEHHSELAKLDPNQVGAALTVDGAKKNQSTPKERAVASFDLSRALDLCMVDFSDMESFKECVVETKSVDHYYVFDSISDRRTNDTGKRIIAC